MAVRKNSTESTLIKEKVKAQQAITLVYVGPSLPNGVLKANMILQGTREEILEYYNEVIAKYPQVKKLLLPVERLGEVSVLVKTSGNIFNKYYNDIVEAMRGDKEE